MARELYEDARARQIQAEIAFQSAAVDVQILKIEIDRARHELGHCLEIERAKWATVRAAAADLGEELAEMETDEISHARAAVRAHEQKLESAEEALRLAADQRTEASRAAWQASEEFERLL